MGVALRSLVYLGVVNHWDGRDALEVTRRIDAARRNWAILWKFWVSEKNWSTKLFVFQAAVSNTTVSGLTTCVLPHVLTQRIDGFLAKKARILLKGKAHRVRDDGTHDTMTNLHVMHECKITPTRIEVMVRRLRELQSFARNPNDHDMELTALFGDYRLGGCDDDGRLNPWGAQLYNDLCVCLIGFRRLLK